MSFFKSPVSFNVDSHEGAIRIEALIRGKKLSGICSMSFTGMPTDIGKNSADAEVSISLDPMQAKAASRILGTPVKAAYRIHSISVPDDWKGHGIGQALYLKALQVIPKQCALFNSQATTEAERAQLSLQSKGLVTIGGPPTGVHAMMLTRRGASTKPGSLVTDTNFRMKKESGIRIIMSPKAFTALLESEAKYKYWPYKPSISPKNEAGIQAILDACKDCSMECAPHENGYNHGVLVGGDRQMSSFIYPINDDFYISNLDLPDDKMCTNAKRAVMIAKRILFAK